jgi:ABC-type multidrug transport system ATPase subunit
MLAIKAQNLSKKFGALTAVNGLNLEVKKGEIFGLVGPDGAGKTTTIRMFSGILVPTSGEAWVLDHLKGKNRLHGPTFCSLWRLDGYGEYQLLC